MFSWVKEKVFGRGNDTANPPPVRPARLQEEDEMETLQSDRRRRIDSTKLKEKRASAEDEIKLLRQQIAAAEQQAAADREQAAADRKRAEEEAAVRKAAEQQAAADREQAAADRKRADAAEEQAKKDRNARLEAERLEKRWQLAFEQERAKAARYREELVQYKNAVDEDQESSPSSANTVRDLTSVAPILKSPIRPTWDNPGSDSSRTSTKFNPDNWLRFSPDHVRKWEDADFIELLRSAPPDLLEELMSGQATGKMASILTGDYLDRLGQQTILQRESGFEDFAEWSIWELLRNMTDLSNQEAFPVARHLEIKVPTGANSTMVLVPEAFTQLLFPDRIIETRRRQDGAPLSAPPPHRCVVHEQGNFLPSHLIEGTGRAIVEFKMDHLCPISKAVLGSTSLLQKETCKDVVGYTKSALFKWHSDPVSQVATYGVALLTKYVSICTLNRMAFGEVEVSEDGSQHSVRFTRTFSWHDAEEQFLKETGWSHWEVLFRFILATLDKSSLPRYPDAFKEMAKIKTASRDTSANDSNKKAKPDGAQEPQASSSNSAAPRAQGSGASPPSASSKATGSAALGEEQVLLPPFEAFCWADLWAPARFAVPSTHPPEVELSLSKLEGDADVLGKCRAGTVYRKAPLQGRDVVIKVARFGECQARARDEPSFEQRISEMEREERVYGRLSAIQGRFVPRFLWCGSLFSGLAHGLATEYAGETFATVEEIPNRAQARDRALVALDAIHGHGVLHGDIALRNLVFRRSRRPSGDDRNIEDAVWIDFGFSEFKEEVDESSWAARCAQEVSRVRDLFACEDEDKTAAEQQVLTSHGGKTLPVNEVETSRKRARSVPVIDDD